MLCRSAQSRGQLFGDIVRGESIVAFDEVGPEKEDEDIGFDRPQPQNRIPFLAFVCESSRAIRPRERLLVQDDFQK